VTVSGVDITTRTSTTTYDSLGEFATSNANALGQSESWVYDPRFGKPTSHTGPNGLVTTWSYDVYGRKTQEVRSDGTQTAWAHLFCSGYNGGTASCVTGAVYLAEATPLASDGVTQNGPLGIVYFDVLDREIGRDTQGFDGSLIRVSKQYNSNGMPPPASPRASDQAAALAKRSSENRPSGGVCRRSRRGRPARADQSDSRR
jgi:YD repeat-containing protein